MGRITVLFFYNVSIFAFHDTSCTESKFATADAGIVKPNGLSMLLVQRCALFSRVTWGMTAPGGKTAPPPVDNLKLPRTFTEYTEWCYHLPDTCFERSTPKSRRKLEYSIFNIYTIFDVIFPHHYNVIVICIFVIIKNVIHPANTLLPL